MADSCVFCEIVAGDSPVSAFYEDDLVLGLMTHGPVNAGHAMVIPKAHATYLADLDEETGRHLWTITQRTAAAVRESGVKCEGVNLFLADGEAAGQEVFHLHMHIIPRFVDDPFKLVANWEYREQRNVLDRVAGQIASAYQRLWPN